MATRGAGRRQVLKAQREEDLREKLKAYGVLGHIFKNLQWLERYVDGDVMDLALRNKQEGLDLNERKAKADAVSVLLNNNFKLLTKLLPDLKAVEITDQQERTYVVSGQPLTDGEWETKYCLGASDGATDQPH